MRRFMLVSLAMAACSSSEAVRSGDGAEAGRPAGGASAQGGASAGAAQPGAAGSPSDAGESIGGTSSDGKGGSAGVADDAGQGGMGNDAGAFGGASGEPSVADGGAAASAGEPSYAGAGGASPTNEPPTVAILLDGSSSMFTPRELLWDAIREAMLDPVNGVIPTFAPDVRIGFSIFRGDRAAHEETDPLCATITATDFALDNEASIAAAYDAVTAEYEVGVGWETPTGHAIRRVTSTLDALPVPDGSRKYIVLITDGNPNTCLTVDPQCGQDLVVKAVQDAYDLGIRTLIFGTGELLQPENGCGLGAPCGPVHLQDVANAGVGRPVAAPSPNYRYQLCVVDNVLTADYATVGGTAAFYTGTTMEEMRSAIHAMMARIVAGEVP